MFLSLRHGNHGNHKLFSAELSFSQRAIWSPRVKLLDSWRKYAFFSDYMIKLQHFNIYLHAFKQILPFQNLVIWIDSSGCRATRWDSAAYLYGKPEFNQSPRHIAEIKYGSSRIYRLKIISVCQIEFMWSTFKVFCDTPLSSKKWPVSKS